jgi:hypothetical protein
MKLAGFVLLGAAVLAVMGCFYMPSLGGRGGTARANIGLGKGFPANLTGTLTLIVGGPGMSTITRQYPQGTTTSEALAIPSGVARTFTLTANTPSVALLGQQTVDLAPGETKDVTLTSVATGSQIIVPDNLNGRLVQVADMNGTNWITLTSPLYPTDVDFDDQGRIYIANTDANSDGIVRVDDISGANPTGITGSVDTYYVQSIAMDRARGILYFTTGSNLYRIQVTPTVGAPEQIVTTSVIEYISTMGIAVDSDGFVYIANGQYGTPAATILKLKIDPSPATSATVVASYSSGLTNPWDVLVKGDFVYVSDFGARQIVRLTKALTFVDSFSGPAPGTDPSQEFV